jgi:hypothetical protein
VVASRIGFSLEDVTSCIPLERLSRSLILFALLRCRGILIEVRLKPVVEAIEESSLSDNEEEEKKAEEAEDSEGEEDYILEEELVLPNPEDMEFYEFDDMIDVLVGEDALVDDMAFFQFDDDGMDDTDN